LPLKLDKVDAAILRELSRDGRLSFRQLSKLVGVSTPTVENHYRKLLESGIITRFTPILNPDKVEGGTSALIFLRVDLDHLTETVDRLCKMEQARNVFLTTGEANVVVRVVLPPSEPLELFMRSSVGGLGGVRVVSSEIITQTRKDESGALFREGMAVNLVCDYCGKEVTDEPLVLNVGQGKRFFCCSSCLSLYKAKYIEKRPYQY